MKCSNIKKSKTINHFIHKKIKNTNSYYQRNKLMTEIQNQMKFLNWKDLASNKVVILEKEFNVRM